MNVPRISVVIPTYHRNDLLAKCLDCLVPGFQTLLADQYEVIVTDDGSKSTAEEMVRAQYPWVRWVAGPKRGPAANRNNGASFAQGEWLAFTDDDCLPAPEWLQAFAVEIQHDTFVYEGRTICSIGICSPLYTAPVNLSGGYLWSCNMMINKQKFIKLSGFDEKFPHPHLEDVDLRKRIYEGNTSTKFVASAKVDHPPRKINWVRQFGAAQESEMYYWYKNGNHSYYRNNLLLRLTNAGIRHIIKNRFGIDSIKALAALSAALIYYIRYSSSWEKKYRHKFDVT